MSYRKDTTAPNDSNLVGRLLLTACPIVQNLDQFTLSHCNDVRQAISHASFRCWPVLQQDDGIRGGAYSKASKASTSTTLWGLT